MENNETKIINRFQIILNPSQKICWYIFVAMGVVFFFSYAFGWTQLVPGSNRDNDLLFNLGYNIASGQWLGAYDSLTLAKGPGLPIFLALCIKTGIPYKILITPFYILASFYFLWKSEYLFDKYKIFWVFAGFILLFNLFFIIPAPIYREQLMITSVVVLLGTFAALFDKSSKRYPIWAHVVEAVFVAISFGFLLYSREEGIIYKVAIFFALLLFCISVWKLGNKKTNALPLLYGLCGFFIFYLSISYMNYSHYGKWIIFEKTSGGFPHAMKMFHSVHDENPPKYGIISREKVIYIANAVPMFKELAGCLIPNAERWGRWSSVLDRQTLARIAPPPIDIVGHSHFEWVVLECADYLGYYESAQMSDGFYQRLANEINLAVQNDNLKQKKGFFINFSSYEFMLDDFYVFIRMLPLTFNSIFTGSFDLMLNSYKSIAPLTEPSSDKNYIPKYKNALKVNIILKNDVATLKEAEGSISYKFWHIVSKIYSPIAYALLMLLIPLVWSAVIVSLIKRDFIYSFVLMSFACVWKIHFLLLNFVSMLFGGWTLHSYYSSSYIVVMLSSIFSIYYLVLIYLKKNIKENMNDNKIG